MKAKKNHFLYLLLTIVFLYNSCGSGINSNPLEIQEQYLDRAIIQALEKLEDEVMKTGAPEHGIEIRALARDISSRLDVIQKEDDINQLKTLIKDYLEFSQGYLSEDNKRFFSLLSSIDELKTHNVNETKSLLKIFTKDVIDAYHYEFLDTFVKFDIVKVNVQATNSNITYGDDYEIKINLIGAMSTLAPEIMVKSKKDGRSFLIPVEGPFSEGVFKIGRMPQGENTIYIKYTFLDGGVKRSIDAEHNFFVAEPK